MRLKALGGGRPVLPWEADEEHTPSNVALRCGRQPYAAATACTDYSTKFGIKSGSFDLDRVPDLAQFLVADLAANMLPDPALLLIVDPGLKRCPKFGRSGIPWRTTSCAI